MKVDFFVCELEMCLALMAVSSDHRTVLVYLRLSSPETVDCNAQNCNTRLSNIILYSDTSANEDNSFRDHIR